MKKLGPLAIILALVLFGTIGFFLRKNTKTKESSVSEQQTTISQTPTSTNSPEADKESGASGTPTAPTITSGTTPPVVVNFHLSVSQPANNATVSGPSVVVRGTTSPQAEIYVNDVESFADAKGNFSVTLSLDEGENLIVITAIDAEGNVADKELTVNYDSGN